MNRHLKTVILKALAFTLLMGLWNYWMSNNYDDFHASIRTIIFQAMGGGVLFGIFSYYFNRPEKQQE